MSGKSDTICVGEHAISDLIISIRFSIPPELSRAPFKAGKLPNGGVGLLINYNNEDTLVPAEVIMFSSSLFLHHPILESSFPMTIYYMLLVHLVPVSLLLHLTQIYGIAYALRLKEKKKMMSCSNNGMKEVIENKKKHAMRDPGTMMTSPVSQPVQNVNRIENLVVKNSYHRNIGQ